jgi:hypothetical protein
MAIDLADLVEPLKTEVSPPGTDLFPDATDEQYLANLQNAFWNAKLDGLMDGYTESDGSVSAITPGDPELSRELQQVIVLYASIHIVVNHMRSLDTLLRSKAGPVEFETQKSGPLLKALLDELLRRRNMVLVSLGEIGSTDSYYIDAVAERDISMQYGDTYWVR